jgi:hypothetical protein
MRYAPLLDPVNYTPLHLLYVSSQSILSFVLKKANTAPTQAVTKESTLKVALGGWVSLFDKLYALLRKS